VGINDLAQLELLILLAAIRRLDLRSGDLNHRKSHTRAAIKQAEAPLARFRFERLPFL
jgi:hypothetical protein